MPFKPQRKRTRLGGYDYSSPGVYFVTICTHHHTCLFGEVIAGKMHLNPAGKLVQETWVNLPAIYPYVVVEPYIIMPNHVHGLIEIKSAEGLPINNADSKITTDFDDWIRAWQLNDECEDV